VPADSDTASAAKKHAAPAPGAASAESQPPPEDENKKSLFKRIFGIFGGGKKDAGRPTQGAQDPQQ
jgi:hypothetical protein